MGQTYEFGHEDDRGRAYPSQELPGATRSGQNRGREPLAGLGSDREGVELGSHGAVSGSDRGQKTKGHA